MNQNIRENLSAGIDGELSKEQLRFLLRQIDHDPKLKQVWTRYQLAGDGLRRELPTMATPDFAARVMLAIERESLPVGTSRRHWLHWSAGGAIAASVAAAALMISQPTGDTGRNATAALSSQQQTSTAAHALPANRSATPAVVPPWLSANSTDLLSQQASATLGAPFDANQPIYTRRLSAYPSLPRYRTLDNKDGSYLLLLDPQPRVGPADISHRAAAVGQ